MKPVLVEPKFNKQRSIKNSLQYTALSHGCRTRNNQSMSGCGSSAITATGITLGSAKNFAAISAISTAVFSFGSFSLQCGSCRNTFKLDLGHKGKKQSGTNMLVLTQSIVAATALRRTALPPHLYIQVLLGFDHFIPRKSTLRGWCSQSALGKGTKKPLNTAISLNLYVRLLFGFLN